MSTEAESLERTFVVGDTGELVLSDISGTVEIRGWDAPEIAVSATKRPGGLLPWITPEEGYRATRIEFEQQGARVIVRTTRVSSDFWGFVRWLGGVAQVDYVVRAPRRCAVVVDLVAGRLDVADLLGNVITRTVSAGQVLRRLQGNIVVSTVSGGVSAEDLAGKAAVRTVSGGVKVTGSALTALSGRSVSGKLDVETPLHPGGSYEFQTVSGDIRLALPPGAGCSAELQSLSGSIHSDTPADVREVRRGQWRAEIRGGGPKVQVTSVSGGLRFGEIGVEAATEPAAPPAAADLKPEPPPVAAQPPAPEVRDEEQADRESIMMMILQAVERGELSVEEAASKLAELDRLGRGS